jgi:hypothetical protein
VEGDISFIFVPIRVIGKLSLHALNILHEFLHDQATARIAQASNVADNYVNEARATYREVENTIDELRTTATTAAANKAAEVQAAVKKLASEFDRVQDTTMGTVSPHWATIKLNLGSVNDDTSATEVIDKLRRTVDKIQSDMVIQKRNLTPKGIPAKILYALFITVDYLVTSLMAFFNYMDESPQSASVAFLGFILMAAYISYKLSLAFVRVIVWLCFKMPYYVIVSIFRFIFGLSDEEFDLKENLLNETGDESSGENGDASSNNSTRRTVFDKSEFLSSGLPRRALYGDEEEQQQLHTATVNEMMGDVKDFDNDISFVDSAKEESSTKPAPEGGSATSAILGSVSVVVAALAFLL